MKDKYRIIFIAGPTASGKSDYAYKAAKEHGAVILACDSMQIYKEPQILTNKPPRAMLEDIRHDFIDIVSVTEAYNAYDYSIAAAEKIAQYQKENIPVIVCGGTGMYMKALLDGIFADASKDSNLRRELELKDESELYRELQKTDPAAAQKISMNDKRRLVRALEVYYTGGKPISERQKDIKGIWGKYDIEIIGINIERDKLYARINMRTEEMFERGALEEAKQLLAMPLSLTAQHIIGLKEIKSHLDGNIDLSTCKELIKQNTRRYAKRQMTWFNKDKRIKWAG